MMRDRNGAETQTDQHAHHALSQGPTAVKLAQATSKEIRTSAWAGTQLNPQMESENIFKVPRKMRKTPIYL